MWLKRSIQNPDRKWVKILNQILRDIKFVDFIHTSCTTLVEKLPDYYINILNIWKNNRDENTNNVHSIQNQMLWFNNSITIEGKSFIWEKWYKSGIVRFSDILQSNGHFMSHEEITEVYHCECSFLDILKIRMAIPSLWRKSLFNCCSVLQTTPNGILSKDKTRLIALSNFTSKQVYWHLFTKSETISPACKSKWESIYPDTFFSLDWMNIFNRAFIVCEETYLQSFQYKIIHRIFPCNYWLNIIKIKDNAICENCLTEDTLSHYFVKCLQVQPFWHQLCNWWSKLYNASFYFNEMTVLFGVRITTEESLLFNYILIIAKWFIYATKRVNCNTNVDFFKFLPFLKNKVVLKLLAREKTGHCNNLWSQLCENL